MYQVCYIKGCLKGHRWLKWHRVQRHGQNSICRVRHKSSNQLTGRIERGLGHTFPYTEARFIQNKTKLYSLLYLARLNKKYFTWGAYFYLGSLLTYFSYISVIDYMFLSEWFMNCSGFAKPGGMCTFKPLNLHC